MTTINPGQIIDPREDLPGRRLHRAKCAAISNASVATIPADDPSRRAGGAPPGGQRTSSGTHPGDLMPDRALDRGHHD